MNFEEFCNEASRVPYYLTIPHAKNEPIVKDSKWLSGVVKELEKLEKKYAQMIRLEMKDDEIGIEANDVFTVIKEKTHSVKDVATLVDYFLKWNNEKDKEALDKFNKLEKKLK